MQSVILCVPTMDETHQSFLLMDVDDYFVHSFILPKKLSSGSLIINPSLAQRHDIIFHQPKLFRHFAKSMFLTSNLYMNVQRTRPLLFFFGNTVDLLGVRGKNKNHSHTLYLHIYLKKTLNVCVVFTYIYPLNYPVL